MSSGVIFVPGSFGFSLKRPKRRFQSNMKACEALHCKQLYDPDSPANKLFYATPSNGKRLRRELCPMHASIFMEEQAVKRGTLVNTATERSGTGSGKDRDKWTETPSPATFNFRTTEEPAPEET